jgi:F-type H+-transporting ATPase subunit b
VFELGFILAQHGGAEAAEHSVPALLDPHSWGLVFWSAVTFCVVLAILRKAAWGPIIEGLDKRERTISDAIAAAQKDRVEAAKLLEEHRKKLETVRNEAQAILNETASDAKHMMEEAQAKANAEAEATRQRALRDIEMAKAKAVDEIKQSSVDLAMALAEKVLGSEVDRAKQRRLVEDFVKSYERN